MEHVSIDDVEPAEVNPALRILTAPLGTTDVAINRYDVPPGGQVGGGYHTHHDQEEVFYVLSGTVTIETEDGDGAVDLRTRSVIVEHAVPPRFPSLSHTPIGFWMTRKFLPGY